MVTNRFEHDEWRMLTTLSSSILIFLWACCEIFSIVCQGEVVLIPWSSRMLTGVPWSFLIADFYTSFSLYRRPFSLFTFMMTLRLYLACLWHWSSIWAGIYERPTCLVVLLHNSISSSQCGSLPIIELHCKNLPSGVSISRFFENFPWVWELPTNMGYFLRQENTSHTRCIHHAST